MFKGFYDKARFAYIHQEIDQSDLFSSNFTEIIPKTACFFSEDLDVYIDTSDGVNDDLQIQEYCGRMLSCIKMSSGKKFLFFKSAYSNRWSKNIESLAADNNGKVVPFFKWSFNNYFYDHVQNNTAALRLKSATNNSNLDIGLFADFNKSYRYPKSSVNDNRVSFNDIEKFGLQDILGEDKTIEKDFYKINARETLLAKIKESNFSIYHGALSYPDYIAKSLNCRSVLNPPGVGEYTSRMFDQTAIGNLIVLRKNSYDNGVSWKDYIPEVDFSNENWQDEFSSVIENRDEWRKKGMFYFDNIWSPSNVFSFLEQEIEKYLS